MRGFAISEEESRDLIAFLESLTDPAFLADPRFADPWKSDGRDDEAQRAAAQ